jgi:hypothetical protein
MSNNTKDKKKVVKKPTKPKKTLTKEPKYDNLVETINENSGLAAYKTLINNGQITDVYNFLEGMDYAKDYGINYIAYEINASCNTKLTPDDLSGIINRDLRVATLLKYRFKDSIKTDVDTIGFKDVSEEIYKAVYDLAIGGTEKEITITKEDVLDKDGHVIGEKSKTVTKMKKRLGNFSALELLMNIKLNDVKTQHRAIDVTTDSGYDTAHFVGFTENSTMFDKPEELVVDLDKIGQLEGDEDEHTAE